MSAPPVANGLIVPGVGARVTRARVRVPGAASSLIAGLCLAGAGTHLVTVVAALASRPAGAGLHAWLFAAMAVVCLGCAGHLLRTRSRAALLMSAGMAALMIAVHLTYLFMVAPSFAGTVVAHHRLVVASAAQLHASHASHIGHAGLSPGAVLPLLAELGVLAVALPALRRLRTTG